MKPITQCPRCEGTGKYGIKLGDICLFCSGSGNLDANGKGVWRCLSLWEPWAMLGVIGAKPLETRGHRTNVRGPLLFHAAQKWNKELEALCMTEPFRTVLGPYMAAAAYAWGLPVGCIVGRVDLTDCFQIKVPSGMFSRFLVKKSAGIEQSFNLPTGDALAFGDFTPGRFAWKLDNPLLFDEPVKFKGAQGFFFVPHDVVAGKMKAGVV